MLLATMTALLLSLLAAAALLPTKAEAFTPICSDQARLPSALAALNANAVTHSTVVIGGGRIGSILAEGATLLGRQDSIALSIDPAGTGPIYVATRNDVLEGIVDDCPAGRRKDLVFLQNGYLDGFLERKGLLQNTQALLYLSVPAMGVDPVDGITSVNPEGLTAATGEWAQAFADKLATLDLKMNVVTPEQYRPGNIHSCRR